MSKNSKSIKNANNTTSDTRSKNGTKAGTKAISGGFRIPPLYIVSFIVPFILTIVGLAIGGIAPFGSKDIMTASGHESMIPFYHELWDRAHNGTLLAYNYTNGYDFSKVFLYYMSDPLNLILLIFPKYAMFAVMSILYAVKIGVSGLAASMFFRYRKTLSLFSSVEMEDERAEDISDIEAAKKEKRDKKRAKNNGKKDFKIGGSEAPRTRFGTFISRLDIISFTLSMGYALCGFMITDGAHIGYTGAIALFPLVLLGLEKLISEKRSLLYIIAFTLTVFSNVYIAMIEFIFMLIYVPLKDYKSLKEGLEVCLRKLLLDIISVGAGMVVILNAFGSSVFKKDFTLNFPYWEPMANIADSFTEMMVKSTPSPYSLFKNGADLYIGIFFMFIFVLYLLNPNIRPAARIKNVILTMLLLLGTIFPTANHFFNAFRDTSYFYCTYLFTFTIFILTLGQDALTNIKHTKTWHILLSFALTMGMTIFSMMFSSAYTGPNSYLVSMELLLAYFVIALMWKGDSMTKLVFDVLTSLICIAEICFSFTGNLGYIGNTSKLYAETETAQIERTAQYMLETYPDSTLSKTVFYKQNQTNMEPVSMLFGGVRYVCTPEGTKGMDFNLEKIDSYSGMDIYRNNYFAGGGVRINGDLSKVLQEYDYFPYESLNELTDMILGDSVDSQIYEMMPKNSDDIQVATWDLYDRAGNIITKDRAYNIEIGQGLKGDIYGSTAYTIHVGNTNKATYAEARQDLTAKETGDKIFRLRFYALDHDIYEKLYEVCTSNIMTDNSSSGNKTPDNTITIPTSDKDGYSLLLPLTDRSSWKIKGFKNAKPLNIWDESYLVARADKGASNFSIAYGNSNFAGGIVISLLVILLIAAVTVMKTKASAAEASGSSENTSNGFLTGLNFISDLMESHVIRIAEFISKYRAYIINITFTAGIFLIFMMIRSITPFGDNTLIVSDGYHTYYPSLMSAFESLKSGDLSLMNFHAGLFSDNGIAGLATYLNPFNWLLLLFPAEKAMEGVSLIFFLRFILTGPTLIYYLTHRVNNAFKLTDSILIPASICYSLCTYFTGYFIFYVFFDIALCMPFTILAMERLIYEKNIKYYVIVMAITMFYNNFQAFQLCEFLLLYFFTFKYKDFKDFFFKGVRFGLCSILSACIAAIGLVPLYLTTRVSAYTKGVTSLGTTNALPSVGFDNTFFKSFKDLMVLAEVNLTTPDSTKANSYAGILILFFLGVFLLNKKYSLYERISKSILILLLYFAYGNELLNYIFHGFHIQTLVPNRFAIFIIFMAVVIFADSFYMYEALDKKKAQTVAALCGLGVILMTIMGDMDCINSGLYTNKMVVTIILAAIYMALILKKISFSSVEKTIKKAGYITSLLAVLLVFEVVITDISNIPSAYGSFIPVNEISNRYVRNITENEDMNASIDRIEYYDKGRSDELFNNAFRTDTYGISYFASTITKAHLEAFNIVSIPTTRNTVSYGEGNPISDTFLNVRYRLDDSIRYLGKIPNYMNKVDRDNSITMYESPYALSFGFNIPDSRNIDELGYKYFDNITDYHNAITNQLADSDLYTIYKMEPDKNVLRKLPEDYKTVSSTANDKITWSLREEPSDEMPDFILLGDNSFNYSVSHNVFGIRRGITSNNTYIKLHIPEGISGDIYIGNKKLICYITSTDGSKDTNVTLPFYYYVVPGKTELECMNEQLSMYNVAILNEDTMAAMHDNLSTGCFRNITHDFSSINADITVTEPGTIHLSIPAVNGFTAYVDGRKTDMVSYFGFLGIPVTETGEHHVELKYMTPGLVPGIIISIAGILIFIVVLLILKKQQNKGFSS